jgi:hypothetical protein
MWGSILGAGASIIGGMMGKDAANSAASAAGDAQSYSALKQIEEQRRQYDETKALLAPYVTAGNGAVGAQQDLLGLGGAGAQEQAIYGLAYGPQMSAMVQQGENAMLQNASATGGLRGGNFQETLAQFRPQLLNQMIQQQFSNLGGLTGVGANAAAGQANFGQQSSSNIQAALGQQGAAQAGVAMANGRNNAQFWGGLGQMGSMMGSGGGGFGSGSLPMGSLF